MIIIDINGNKRECVTAYPDKDHPGYIKAEYKRRSQTYIEWYPAAKFEELNRQGLKE